MATDGIGGRGRGREGRGGSCSLGQATTDEAGQGIGETRKQLASGWGTGRRREIRKGGERNSLGCRVGHASVASEPAFACQPGPAVQSRPATPRSGRGGGCFAFAGARGLRHRGAKSLTVGRFSWAWASLLGE